MTFASGPAFFIAAGILVGTFVGIAITREVLSHYRNKRMTEYEQTLAHIEMRDKTAEYYLATQQAATQRAEAEKENLNAPIVVNSLQYQTHARPVNRQGRAPSNSPVDPNRAVAASINFGGLINNNTSSSKQLPAMHSESQSLLAASYN